MRKDCGTVWIDVSGRPFSIMLLSPPVVKTWYVTSRPLGYPGRFPVGRKDAVKIFSRMSYKKVEWTNLDNWPILCIYYMHCIFVFAGDLSLGVSRNDIQNRYQDYQAMSTHWRFILMDFTLCHQIQPAGCGRRGWQSSFDRSAQTSEGWRRHQTYENIERTGSRRLQGWEVKAKN